MIEFRSGEMYYSYSAIAEYAEEMELSFEGFAALLILLNFVQKDTRMLHDSTGSILSEEDVWYTGVALYGTGLAELMEKDILQYPLKDKLRGGKSPALLDVPKEVRT